MPKPAAPGGPGWLTLQEASERLDVHPATLRQWADRGRVRSVRTPGGHRRFSAEDVDALLTALPPDLELLLNAALGRTRRELGAGRVAGTSWYRLLDPGTRDRYRQLGRELLGLLVRSLVPGADPAPALAGARQAGREQGRIAAQAGLTLAEAAGAHAAFRDLLVESVLQTKAVQDQGRPAHDLVRSYREVGAFLDEVLVAYLDAFSATGR
ncbi:MAG TPA: helix-turn-helix domain-containing protein [Candidatus Eisenbacteria bacterium]|nr:helix-turn-helix domain-containing protein [Candidatus Eisenbacteria bacterium]